MVQFPALFNILSKNIYGDKNIRSRDVGKEASTDLVKEAKKNQLLLTCSGAVSGRNVASAHSRRGKKGFNQDSFVVWEEFGCQEGMVFCGVFDGHGPWGHLVSKTVRKLLPPSLLCNWQEGLALDSHEQIEFNVWKQSFYKTCAAVDREIQQHPRIDSFYSGTTALAVVRQDDVLTVANVGDSRAVLANVSDDGNLVATQLTIDQKPNLPHENERIAQSKGRVYSCPDEPGLYRVWMPTVEGPGLAVSRAFGDYYIKEFGLISEPVVTQRNICKSDQFVILATDGVWDVVSNEEAVKIVSSTQVREESAKRLVQFAARGWKQRGKAAVMDDISAICLFLQHNNLDSDFQDKKCV